MVSWTVTTTPANILVDPSMTVISLPTAGFQFLLPYFLVSNVQESTWLFKISSLKKVDQSMYEVRSVPEIVTDKFMLEPYIHF